MFGWRAWYVSLEIFSVDSSSALADRSNTPCRYTCTIPCLRKAKGQDGEISAVDSTTWSIGTVHAAIYEKELSLKVVT